LKSFTFAGVTEKVLVTFLKKFRSQGIAKHYALLNQQISTKVLGQKARRLPNQAKSIFTLRHHYCLKKPSGIVVGTTSDFAAIQTTLPENRCLLSAILKIRYQYVEVGCSEKSSRHCGW
jgi:hypothetical protein